MELELTGRDRSEDSQSHQAIDEVSAKSPSAFPALRHQAKAVQQ